MRTNLLRLEQGDALSVLGRLTDSCVHCVVTSPPYFGLRDYGLGSAQLGAEPTPDQYIASLVEIFREVRRVLHPSGTLYLNLGDSYYAERDSITLSSVDASWLAALIDGEGCIQIHRQRRLRGADSFQVDVSVGMKDAGMVKRAYEITNRGSWGIQNRGVWDWSVRGQQAADLLRAIFPYLILKRGQASLACMLADDLRERAFSKKNPVTPEAVDYRDAIKTACSRLNQRETTDFPIRPPILISTLGLKPKDLIGIPWRVALALQADGWILRSDVIWHKPNPMPESVRDRPTKSHEYLFLFAKSPRYFYDAEAIKEPPSGRNRRTVWTIPTQPYKGAHFATFPERLVEPCILASTSAAGCCPWCLAPYCRILKRDRVPTRPGTGAEYKTKDPQRHVTRIETVGWKPSCDCSEPFAGPCTVLDPFAGTCTAGVVANRHGRRFIGIEMNPDYLALARRRLNVQTGAVDTPP